MNPDKNARHKIEARAATETQRVMALRQDFSAVFNSASESGERVMAMLKASLFYEQSTHVPGDPCSTAFNEGKREAMLMILRMLRPASVEQIEAEVRQHIAASAPVESNPFDALDKG